SRRTGVPRSEPDRGGAVHDTEVDRGGLAAPDPGDRSTPAVGSTAHRYDQGRLPDGSMPCDHRAPDRLPRSSSPHGDLRGLARSGSGRRDRQSLGDVTRPRQGWVVVWVLVALGACAPLGTSLDDRPPVDGRSRSSPRSSVLRGLAPTLSLPDDSGPTSTPKPSPIPRARV